MRKSMLLILAAAQITCMAEPIVQDLWAAEPPGPPSKTTGAESDLTKPTDNLVAGRRLIRLGNVSKPQIHVFLPPAEKSNGTAVVVCPGGGYNILAWDLEGTEVAEWLNGIGVAAAIVKYRVPTSGHKDNSTWDGREVSAKSMGPLIDAQRAVSLMRSRAGEWKIDAKRIGILGFSAGGETAVLATVHRDARAYTKVDASDELSCAPNFAVVIYPGYLADNTGALRANIPVTKETPPMFFAHAADDPVKCESSIALFLALKNAGVPAEMHIYDRSGHGYGLRANDKAPVTDWPKRCETWMKVGGWLAPLDSGSTFFKSPRQIAGMTLHGHSLIAGKTAPDGAKTFHATSPLDGKTLEPAFHEAGEREVDTALRHAEEAFEIYRRTSANARADFLDVIANEIVALGDDLLQRAHVESGLPLDRLTGERTRTCSQLKAFGALIREGSWVDARIDHALPERQPLPRPDLRRMLVPLGPIVVMGASNFPLAFSTAGGDTASALAAGCPVVMKAHGSHPGTAELVATAIYRAIEKCGMAHGVFSMLHGAGAVVAQALVRHPLTKGLGFTGSVRAGRALFDAAAARPEPIPVFAEMGSVNPVFILPEALKSRGSQIAAGLKSSFTLGVGQFCTKPGIVFALGGADFDAFAGELRTQIATTICGTMLNRSICTNFYGAIERIRKIPGVFVLGESDTDADETKTQGEPVAFVTDVDTFLLHHELRDEIFGPYTLLVTARSVTELEAAARSLAGNLTATFHGTDHDITAFADLRGIVERRVGRIVFNGFPTGVEVGPTMQHGGPYPASTDSRYTSVGTAAILRWARPLCWQNFPHAALPEELRDENPRKLMRTVNGILTR